MDITKENIVKFIDSMIVDNYSKAHKFLEVIVNESVKKKIKKAKKLKPFEKATKESAKKSAFGGEFPQEKNPNKQDKSTKKKKNCNSK